MILYVKRKSEYRNKVINSIILCETKIRDKSDSQPTDINNFYHFFHKNKT